MKIARFILGAPTRVRNMSIASLADACNTSTATVSRFSRTLGYSGYKEFQLDLATSLAQSGTHTLDHFANNAPPEAVIQQVFECNRQSLVETQKLLDKKVLIQVAKAIRNAGTILFLGFGSSGAIARIAASRFTSLGLTAMAEQDPYAQIFATANIERNDVVVGISHSGRTAHIVEGIKAARIQKARTVAITNYPRSPVAQASEFRLITAFREHRLNAAVSSSCVAQMCVIDSLYFVLASWASKGARKLADQAESRVVRLLR